MGTTLSKLAFHAPRGLSCAMPSNAARKRALGLASSILAIVCVAASGSAAQAADLAALPDIKGAADQLSTFGNYVQFYGVLDAGVSYQTHGNSYSNLLPTNVNSFLTKYNNHPNFAISSNGLSFSTIGAKGSLPIFSDLNGVFQLDTSFMPTSGSLANGPGSVAQNNGRAAYDYSSFGDSNKAGQAFNGNANAGLESKTFGRLTFGRNSTLMNDAVCRYDALLCAPAFSYVGYYGSAAGIGDTEDRFMDDTLKYTVAYGPIHGGALYQFPRFTPTYGGSAQGQAYQFDLGGTYQNFSVDAIFAHRQDGIFVISPLSAAQVMGLYTLGSPTFGLSTSNTVNALVSDNTAFAIFTKYDAGKLKLFASYENVQQVNPSNPLPIGTATIGGYQIIPNNTAFPHPKITQFVWLGAKYLIDQNFEVAGSWYHIWQNSYGLVPCSTAVSSQCSGSYDALALVVNYKFLPNAGFMKGFDAYAGVVWSMAANGIASGYYQTNNVSPMVGLRYAF